MLLYRLLVLVHALIELSRRAVRGDLAGLRARLGRVRPDAPSPHLWIHAASNGELASARPVIAALAEAGQPILLTSNTETGVDLAASWTLPRLTPLLAPLDTPRIVRRVHRNWNVTGHLTFESDLWPNRVLLCPGPVAVLGARLTERSARGWRRFGTLAPRVLSRVAFLSAQDAASRDRFMALGLPEAAVGPVVDLKSFYSPPDTRPDAGLRAAFPRTRTWLAASTHEGEEQVVLAAHREALGQRPDLRLILAPRHPRRADAIARLIREEGLTCARRSLGEDPARAQVYLADTMGEMHLWYALSGIVFIGGSLTDRGGHTPYEPAAFGAALLHGPDTANFRAAYARLADADAAIRVDHAKDISATLIALSEADAQITKGRQAKEALKQEADISIIINRLSIIFNVSD